MANKISDEAVSRLRERIGVARPHGVTPHYLSPNSDAFRHVSEAYGDDNPLYCDPSYGLSTRWAGAIAPPHLVGGDTLIGEDEVTAIEPQFAELMKGDPLRGVHAFYSGSSREWWNPLYPSQSITRRNALVGVGDKKSDFAGRSIHEWTAEVFAVRGGPVLSGQYRLMIRAERERAISNAKNDTVEIRPYTDEEILAITDAVASETNRRRGNTPRYWEDVQEGEVVGPLTKGPLRVTDMVVWHTGMGMGLYGVKALRLAYAQRLRVPRFFRPDSLNIPDVQQRVHWDPDWARAAGNPAPYDYGRMRETWLIHLCTDWMGDSSWLWKLECQFRKFNYVGDTHWVEGTVRRIYETDFGAKAVEIDVAARNQRHETTTTGIATILLPSRVTGDPPLPPVPGGATTCHEVLTALADRHLREPA